MFFGPAPSRPHARPPLAWREGRRRQLPGALYPAARAMRTFPPRPPVPESLQPPLPPLGVLACTRAGFGPRPGDVAAFEALGTTDGARLAAWVGAQLAPGSIPDTDCEQRIAGS